MKQLPVGVSARLTLLQSYFLASSAYMKHLERGYRLERPLYWTNEKVWLVLELTWTSKKKNRPSFVQLYDFFRKMHRFYLEKETKANIVEVIPKHVELAPFNKLTKTYSYLSEIVPSLPSG